MSKYTEKVFLRYILKSAGLLFLSIVLTIWAWNNALTTIFGLPVIHFKEATGIIILAFGVSLLIKPGKYQCKHDSGLES